MMKHLTFDTEKMIMKICKNEPFKYSYNSSNHKILFRKTSGNGILGRRTQFIFPLKIKLKSSTYGLIVGEGYTDTQQFAFGNSNENIIKHILEFLQQFDIPLHFVLEFSARNINNGFITNSKKAWECVINQNINKIRIRKEFNNTTEKGVLHIRCHNSCFSKVLNIIFNKSKKLMETNEYFSKEYIKGLLAAEGNINTKKSTGCLYMVRISAKKKEEREHYKKCLKKIGIKIYCKDMPTIDKNDKRTKFWKTKNGRGGAVLINRWINFYKILEMGLLEIHENKRKKFIKHFMNNKTTKLLLKFKDIPKKWLTMKDFKDIFRLKSPPRDRINRMLSLNFIKVKKIKQKKKHTKRAYCLTNNYYKFIKLLNDAPPING